MSLDLEKVALVTAARYCVPTGSYGIEDAAQLARIALHQQYDNWNPVHGYSRRNFAVQIAKHAVLSGNRKRGHKKAGAMRVAAGRAVNGNWIVDVGQDTWLPPEGFRDVVCHDHGFAAVDAKEAVAHVLKCCTPKQKRVARLFLRGLSFRAIGRRIGRSGQHVGYIMRGIRRRVRKGDELV